MKKTIIAGMMIIAFAACETSPEIPEAPRAAMKRETVIEYRTAPKEKEFWYKMIDYFADQFDVERVVARTIFVIESSEAENNYAYNAKKLKRARKLTGDKLEQDMLVSALCPFQVLGLTAHELGVTWESIAFDPVECVRTGVFYMRKLSDRHRKLPKAERRRMVLLDYYGRDPAGVKYSQKGMALIQKAEAPTHRKIVRG